MKTLREFFTRVERKQDKTKSVALNDDSLIHQHEQENQDQPQTRYQCPMKCEGEKTYDQPGTCPVCNMKLAPVSM
jgi:uncharacterized Fe-S radical SAM superfamily protein PflX